jgi:hypothetical protein
MNYGIWVCMSLTKRISNLENEASLTGVYKIPEILNPCNDYDGNCRSTRDRFAMDTLRN